MHKIDISQKEIHEKKCAKFFLVNSGSLCINQQQEFFHRDLPVFPLILIETLAERPLIQLSFSYFFFFGTKIYKIGIFKNLPFAKISSHKIFKNLPFAKKSTREIRLS